MRFSISRTMAVQSVFGITMQMAGMGRVGVAHYSRSVIFRSEESDAMKIEIRRNLGGDHNKFVGPGSVISSFEISLNNIKKADRLIKAFNQALDYCNPLVTNSGFA